MPITLCHPRIFIPESDEKNGTGFPQLIPCFESRQISWVLQHLDGTFFQHLAGPISIFCCLDYLWPSVFNRHYMVCFIHFSYGSSAEFLILPVFWLQNHCPQQLVWILHDGTLFPNLDGENGIIQQLNIVASLRDLLSLTPLFQQRWLGIEWAVWWYIYVYIYIPSGNL